MTEAKKFSATIGFVHDNNVKIPLEQKPVLLTTIKALVELQCEKLAETPLKVSNKVQVLGNHRIVKDDYFVYKNVIFCNISH